jgi:hypothetical protein
MSASPIRDSAGKLCITPGDWNLVMGSRVVNDDYTDIADADWSANNEADAALIAEAGTVTNATNRTPAELLKERDGWEGEATRLHGENERLAALVRELHGALEAYRKHDPFFMDDNLLTKSEGI